MGFIDNGTYNLTSLKEVNEVSGLFSWANTATGGILISLFMIGVFLVIFMKFITKVSFDNAVMASGFICFMLSSFLWYVGLLSFWFPVTFLVMAAFGIFASFLNVN